MWPAFITAYENCLSDQSYSSIKPKVQGLLKTFRSYRMLCLTCTYLDVLEKIRPASKVFEGDGLLAKQKVISNLSTLLKDRFKDFDEGVYTAMRFFDPENWTGEKDYGNDAITSFANRFQMTLAATGYDSGKVLVEWRMLRNYVKVSFRNVEAEDLRQKIIRFKRDEFPNVCTLAEILIAISGSNSSVERAFSILTNMLSDRRLLMKNRRMESILIIGANDKNWTVKERSEIFERALDIYLEKRRKTQFEPPRKVVRLESEEAIGQRLESSGISSDDESDIFDNSDEDL